MYRCILNVYMILKTKESLDNNSVDYLAPINKIINNKFTQNNEFLMLANNFTSNITVRIKPHNINARSSHGHDHYCTNLND